MSEFECGVCHHLYVKGLPDPDPESTARESMPGFTAAECHLVCDDCWSRLAARIEAAEALILAAEQLLRVPRRAPLLAADPYFDPTFPARPCDHCRTPYNGPAVYCSLRCALRDA